MAIERFHRLTGGILTRSVLADHSNTENLVATIHDESVGAMLAAAPQMLEALKEIAKGEGRFSTDHLKHASNTIDDMKDLATAAIAAASPERVAGATE